MKLVSVYQEPAAKWMLFDLLRERMPEQSISHKAMPTFEEHLAFYHSIPYAAWYAIEHDGVLAGAVYLSRQREIGIGVLKAHRCQGLARLAITELMSLHPGRFLANINPQNEASIKLFRALGFGGPVQITLSKEK